MGMEGVPKISSKVEKDTSPIETPRFDVDAALNTKGFAEFLAAHPEAEKFVMQDGGEVAKRFETFEMKAAVSKEIKELYSEHIEKEMGIKLDANDLSSIERYIETQAIENPQEVLEMRDRLIAFKELPKQIHELETQLAQLGNIEALTTTLDVLQKDAANLETAKNNFGLIGITKLTLETIGYYADIFAEDATGKGDRISGQWDALRAVNEKYPGINKKEAKSLQAHVANQIAEVEKVLDTITEAEQLKAMSQELFNGARKELLSGVSSITELTAAIQTKVSAQLEDMIKSGSIGKLDQAQKRFDELHATAESTETGVNPLGGKNEEDFQEEVDAALEVAASKEITKAVLDAKMGTNALTNLEKALAPFLEREKIGSKEGDDARELIANTLKDVADHLGKDKTEDKAKKLMIARILIKMES